MNAVDTNVFIYSLDRTEPVKQAKAQALLTRLSTVTEPTVLLWQVLGELVRKLRQWEDRGTLTRPEFEAHLRSVRAMFPLHLPTEPVLDHALDLAGRYSLWHWDSMLLGACVEAGVTTLYTEDMGAPRAIDTVQLVNPLV
jgi:predicted nucleic acid-binding protein